MAAASYQNEYTAAKGGAAILAQRVACAVVDYATSVIPTEGAVTGHAARVALATQALTNSEAVGAQFLLPVIVVLGAAGNVAPTDVDIKTTVGSLWNPMCGNV